MTEPLPDREMTFTLRILAVPVCPDGQSPLKCLNCRNALDIHQPDGNLPDRMLATCPECRAWYLIECGTGAGAVIVLLPDCAPWHPARSAPKSDAPRGAVAPR